MKKQKRIYNITRKDKKRKSKKRPWLLISNWVTKYRKLIKALNTVYRSEEGCEIFATVWSPNLFLKVLKRQRFTCSFCTAKKTNSERNCETRNFTSIFFLFAKNEPTVSDNEVTRNAFRSIRIETQVQKNRDNNIIVTGLITEDGRIAVCDVAKEIGGSLTATSFKNRRLGKVNKHVV